MAVEQSFKDSVFNAIDINEVIWIDDRFAKTANKLEDDYLDEIATLYETGKEQLCEFSAFSGLDWGLPLEVVCEELPKDTEVISAFYRYLGREIPDLSTSQFDDLANLLEEASGSKVNNLSHANWVEKKAELLEKDGIKLFLIDLNFEKEGLAEDHGKTIILELLSENIENCYLVLFTSETHFGREEESKRTLIIEGLNDDIKHHHFSVLSKKIIESADDDVSLEFKSAEFLKRIFLRKLSSGMVDSVEKAIIESLKSLKSDLSQNSIYEVDTSIFNNSLKEGVSEFELLHRLFSIKQKEILHKCLTEEPENIEKLKAFRSVQMAKTSTKEKEFIKGFMPTTSSFISLRNTEMFDSSINIIHAPLSSGDVFYFKINEKEEKYILIDQSCDLSVRGSTGKRKSDEVLLIPFEEKTFKQNKSGTESYQKSVNELKYYLLKIASADSDCTFYRFDFSSAITVNSHLLDLAVFNTLGNLTFDITQDDHNLLVLPGWIKRFNDFKNKVITDDSKINVDLPLCYRIFSLLHDEKLPVQQSATSISINGKRINKLRSPFIEELMFSYYVSYKARIAFEMDYS
jgi:hypothetical protein